MRNQIAVQRIVLKAWSVFVLGLFSTQALPAQILDSSIVHQVDTLLAESDKYEYENPSLSQKKAKEAIKLSIVHGYDQGKRDALNSLGTAYIRTAHFDSAQHCLEQAWQMDSTSGRTKDMVAILANLAMLCTRRGEFDAAIDFYIRALAISEKHHYDHYTAALNNNIAGRYRDLDRPEKAIEYCLKAIRTWKGMEGQEMYIGSTYLNLSILCYDFPEWVPKDDPAAAFTYLDQAENYFKICKNEFKLNDCKLTRSNLIVSKEGGAQQAYLLANEATAYFKSTENLVEACDGQLMIAQALSAMGRHSDALVEIRLAKKIAEETGIYDIVQRALFREAEALMFLEMYEQSNAVLNEAYTFRDSVLSHELKLELSEVQEKYEVSREKANRLEMEGIAREEKERAAKLKSTVIIVILLAALLTTILLMLLRQLKNREKVRAAEFQRNLVDEKMQVATLKLQMLGAQMDPHFVKNALSSIQSLLKHSKVNQSDTSSYVEAFARIQRTLLDTASDHTISLADELQMIRDYIKLEQLRFDKSFDFTMVGIEELDLEFDRIPSMMLQPIIENSINHGLSHKGGQGHLKITFKRVDTDSAEVLRCTIEDDGVGQEFTKKLRILGRVSRSTEILRKRLDLFSSRLEHPFGMQVEDLKNSAGSPAGTRTRIQIPLV